MRRILLQLVAAVGLTAASIITGAAQGTSLGPIEISAPWIRAMLPGQPAGGGFMTVTNTGDAADRLVSATAQGAGRVEIHSMAIVDGVMVMRPVDGGLAIEAGQSIELKPGGFHLMLLGVDEPFADGSSVPVTLSFEHAGSVKIDFPVRKAAESQMHDGDHSAAASTDGVHAGDDAAQIAEVMKGTWDRPEAPLAIEPIVVSNGHAIAGWSQDGRGGRALLRKSGHGWKIHLCTGDAVKSADNLRQMGVPDEDADALETALAEAEARLDPDLLALFASFDGTVMMDEGGHHGQGG